MELSDVQIKKRLIELLVKFDEICKANGLRYSLAYGTLLGAIRHKGFIPWDDDIDVLMPQEDYIKFLNLPQFMKQDLNANIVLYEADNNSLISVAIPYMYPFAKLIDGKTYIKSDFFREVGGIWIDIFPVTGLPNDQMELERHFSKMGKWHLKLAAAHRYRKLSECSPIVFLKQVRCNYYFLRQKKVVEDMKKLSFSYSYNTSENVSNSLWGYGKKEVMPRKWYEEYIDIEFEGYQFKGLKYYNEVLTQIYGDWNKIPPEEKRIPHHYYKAYLKEG